MDPAARKPLRDRPMTETPDDPYSWYFKEYRVPVGDFKRLSLALIDALIREQEGDDRLPPGAPSKAARDAWIRAVARVGKEEGIYKSGAEAARDIHRRLIQMKKEGKFKGDVPGVRRLKNIISKSR